MGLERKEEYDSVIGRIPSDNVEKKADNPREEKMTRDENHLGSNGKRKFENSFKEHFTLVIKEHEAKSRDLRNSTRKRQSRH